MDTEAKLLAPEEAAEFLAITRRRILQLPIRQFRLGDRTIRYRLEDIYEFLGIDDSRRSCNCRPERLEAHEDSV